MAKYIELEDAYRTLSDYYHHSTYVQSIALREALDRVPAADVVERKPMAEDVEELIGMMRDYAKECASGDDMCASCQFSYFCEDGWTPDAISDKLVELANQATERKTGKWIYPSDITGFGRCSECKSLWDYSLITNKYFKICPRCGSYNGGNNDV